MPFHPGVFSGSSVAPVGAVSGGRYGRWPEFGDDLRWWPPRWPAVAASRSVCRCSRIVLRRITLAAAQAQRAKVLEKRVCAYVRVWPSCLQLRTPQATRPKCKGGAVGREQVSFAPTLRRSPAGRLARRGVHQSPALRATSLDTAPGRLARLPRAHRRRPGPSGGGRGR